MTGPLITFIVPAYNAARTLPQTLGSLVSPPLASHYQIIVVDDGSTDGTASIAEAFHPLHPGLRVLSQPNGGAGQAKNRGLFEAQTEFITFCDSDDRFFLENYLLLAQAMQLDGSDIGLGTGYSLIGNEVMTPFWDDHTTRRLCFNCSPDERRFVKHLLQQQTATKVWRRDFLNRNTLRFTEGKLLDDIDFSTLALLRTDRIHYAARPLFIYTVSRAGSISSSQDDRRLQVLETIRPLIDEARRSTASPLEFLAILTSMMRVTLWCLENTPAEWVGQFKIRIIETFSHATGVDHDHFVTLSRYTTDQGDQRALTALLHICAGNFDVGPMLAFLDQIKPQ